MLFGWISISLFLLRSLYLVRAGHGTNVTTVNVVTTK